jgi:hypothetical protein
MSDGRTVGAAPQLYELQWFGLLGTDVQALLRHGFIHRRHARFDFGEESARWGLADRQEMRLRRTFDECGKYRGRD